MKPLATPVLGGMVSSLLHVLIVTPAIFYSLRARELKKQSLVQTRGEVMSAGVEEKEPALKES